MKLLTKEILSQLKPLGSESDVAVVKFFHPMSSWTWYASEYDPTDGLFFGLVNGFESELGYFSLAELEGLKICGLGIERDLYFTPTTFDSLRP